MRFLVSTELDGSGRSAMAQYNSRLKDAGLGVLVFKLVLSSLGDPRGPSDELEKLSVGFADSHVGDSEVRGLQQAENLIVALLVQKHARGVGPAAAAA